jgi:hypothetical protein
MGEGLERDNDCFWQYPDIDPHGYNAGVLSQVAIQICNEYFDFRNRLRFVMSDLQPPGKRSAN